MNLRAPVLAAAALAGCAALVLFSSLRPRRAAAPQSAEAALAPPAPAPAPASAPVSPLPVSAPAAAPPPAAPVTALPEARTAAPRGVALPGAHPAPLKRDYTTLQLWRWLPDLTRMGAARGVGLLGPTWSQRIASWDPARAAGAQVEYWFSSSGQSERMVSGKDMEASKEQIAQAYHEAHKNFNPLDVESTIQLARDNACKREHEGEAAKRRLRLRGDIVIQELDCDVREPREELRRTWERLYMKDGKIARRETLKGGDARYAFSLSLDPLVFDLPGQGVQTADRTVLYDVEGFGRADATQKVHDLADGMGLLVFDADGDGVSGGDGREVFGDGTDLGDGKRYADGFEALRAFVARAVERGVIAPEALETGLLDAEALAALEKAYGLKIKVGGLNRPAIPLAQAGIVEIALSRKPVVTAANFDGHRDDLSLQDGAVFRLKSGDVNYYMEVWFASERRTLLNSGR